MRLFSFTLILHLVLSIDVLHAQSTNASLAGRVTDPSKALIVDAKIAAISVDTNTRYEGVTNSSGEFYLTICCPAPIASKLRSRRFKKLIRPDVVLHVQDALEIDFRWCLVRHLRPSL